MTINRELINYIAKLSINYKQKETAGQLVSLYKYVARGMDRRG
jgi:hypothetical protein